MREFLGLGLWFLFGYTMSWLVCLVVVEPLVTCVWTNAVMLLGLVAHELVRGAP